MHILGIANGTRDGNSEILLKAALKAAQETDPSITTSWVHIPSVSIPPNPKPLDGAMDISVGMNEGMSAGNDSGVDIPDDRQALLDGLMDADAYIFSTPIYSHSPAGFLKAVLDRICGPFTDAVFADTVLRMQEAGDPRFAQMKVDRRVLKPRVAGFMAVGGSTTPDQFSMALPILHTLVYPMHVKVVDQVVFPACGKPGSVIARDRGSPVERAMLLGRNVASQLGKRFDDARYLGEEPEGACPFCHLAKVELFYGAENKIGCLSCGAQGALKVGSDNVIRPVWNENCGVSSITWAGKKLHIGDIQKHSSVAAQEIQDCAEFDAKRQQWRDLNFDLLRLPSQQA